MKSEAVKKDWKVSFTLEEFNEIIDARVNEARRKTLRKLDKVLDLIPDDFKNWKTALRKGVLLGFTKKDLKELQS